jgi:hypothetical protein
MGPTPLSLDISGVPCFKEEVINPTTQQQQRAGALTGLLI